MHRRRTARRPTTTRAALLLSSTLLLAACGGGGDDEADPTAEPSAAPTAEVTISTAAPSFGATARPTLPSDPKAKFPEIVEGKKFGEDPTLKFDSLPPPDVRSVVLSEGDGPAVKSGDVIVADFKGQVWEREKLEIPPIENTFEAGGPTVKLIGKGAIIPAWDEKVPGVKVGSRMMLVTPPSGAFGEKGNEKAGVLGLDTLVFVIDIIDTFSPGKTPDGTAVKPPADLPTVAGEDNPKITVPKSDAPKELISQVLVKGKGKAAKAGDTLAVNFRGVLWRNGKQFDATWGGARGTEPIGFTLGADTVLQAWNESLVGKTVGSRLLLVVPPDKGYGSGGNKSAGIEGTDTLVYVIDILGAY